jgi:hypothetical protein
VYADSHKSKKWQRYTAATAAACAKLSRNFGSQPSTKTRLGADCPDTLISVDNLVLEGGREAFCAGGGGLQAKLG